MILVSKIIYVLINPNHIVCSKHHYSLLRSYLSNRKQYVTIGDVTSAVLPITTLLFNIYINDIIKSSPKFNFIGYADDTTLNSTLEFFW